jgi:hypothetical protein
VGSEKKYRVYILGDAVRLNSTKNPYALSALPQRVPIMHKALPEISQCLWRTHLKGKIIRLHLKDSNIFTYKSTMEQVIYEVWTADRKQGCNPNVEVIPFFW